MSSTVSYYKIYNNNYRSYNSLGGWSPEHSAERLLEITNKPELYRNVYRNELLQVERDKASKEVVNQE